MDSRPEQQLLTLKDAAARLNVHPATLRRWADNGDVLVMVTPGGHRRFPRSEIERLAGDHRLDEASDEVSSHLVEAALQNAREGIAEHPQAAWLRTLTVAERNQMREMGRHVMSLLERFVSDDENNDELIREAESIGREYAASTKYIGMGLPAVLEATTFFRDSILESAVSLPEAATMDRDASRRLIRRINAFLSTILISVAQEYDQ